MELVRGPEVGCGVRDEFDRDEGERGTGERGEGAESGDARSAGVEAVGWGVPSASVASGSR
jgi:hypothetical protein